MDGSNYYSYGSAVDSFDTSSAVSQANALTSALKKLESQAKKTAAAVKKANKGGGSKSGGQEGLIQFVGGGDSSIIEVGEGGIPEWIRVVQARGTSIRNPGFGGDVPARGIFNEIKSSIHSGFSSGRDAFSGGMQNFRSEFRSLIREFIQAIRNNPGDSRDIIINFQADTRQLARMIVPHLLTGRGAKK